MTEKKKKVLTTKDILELDDLKRKIIDVPEWGGAVEVRELTAAERGKIAAMMIGPTGKPDWSHLERIQIMAAVYGLDMGEEEFMTLSCKSGPAIERVAEVALEMSGMGGDATKAAEDFLAEIQNGNSPSA